MNPQDLADRPSDPARLRLKNALASVAVVVLALAVYPIAPQNGALLARHLTVGGFGFTGAQFLYAAAAAYAVALCLYFMREQAPGCSKSLRFWQLMGGWLRRPTWPPGRGQAPRDGLALRATLLKALFGPLMTMALMSATVGALNQAAALVDVGWSTYAFRELFDRHLYWLLLQAIVMADVVVFTAGYLVELPRLGNQIRSVDPTWLGWAAALVCYTPLNFIVGALLGPPGSEFPRFDNDTLHYVLNGILLCLIAVYAWASVALGFKASNLTHRGIVAHGPYRWVRHPAYACKNLAWWIGSAPAVAAAFNESTRAGLIVLGSVAGWTLLYVLRAVTEEDHLRRVDGEYGSYAAAVRHRFIPGLL